MSLHRKKIQAQFDQSPLIKNSKKADPACPLNNSQLPPVSDVEHMSHQCFCHLCTCHVHICPSDIKRTLLKSASQFRTNYRDDFRKMALQPTTPTSQRQTRRLNSALSGTWVTTNKHDYVRWDERPQEAVKRESNQLYGLRLTGRSLYQSEFPNWGPVCVEQPQALRSLQMIFGGATQQPTIYQSSFGTKEAQSPQSPQKVLRGHGNTNSFFHKKDWFGKSHSKSEFQGTSGGLTKQEKTRPSEPLVLSISAKHFTTCYKETFKGEKRKVMPKRRNAANKDSLLQQIDG